MVAVILNAVNTQYNVASLKILAMPLGNHCCFYNFSLKYVQPPATFSLEMHAGNTEMCILLNFNHFLCLVASKYMGITSAFFLTFISIQTLRDEGGVVSKGL